MAATVVAVQALFKQGNTLFGEIEGIKYACMALFCIFIFNYQGKKQIGPVWSRFSFSKWGCFVQTFRKQTLLTEEDLPRNFNLDEE